MSCVDSKLHLFQSFWISPFHPSQPLHTVRISIALHSGPELSLCKTLYIPLSIHNTRTLQIGSHFPFHSPLSNATINWIDINQSSKRNIIPLAFFFNNFSTADQYLEYHIHFTPSLDWLFSKSPKTKLHTSSHWFCFTTISLYIERDTQRLKLWYFNWPFRTKEI